MEERKVSFVEPGDEYMKNFSSGPTSRSNLIDFVIRNGFARDRKQAEILLAAFIVTLFGLTIWTLWPNGAGNGVDTSGVSDPREAVQTR